VEVRGASQERRSFYDITVLVQYPDSSVRFVLRPRGSAGPQTERRFQISANRLKEVRRNSDGRTWSRK